ncbi:MAG: twin-arginine translocase subunit TatC [Eggerthellaceae bacterium]|jgi:sec-independent protein translocase protein TatC|nr:twin-arginine translocase subunit TatC [Eggerthellaceae bacterium]MCH4220837.1 twin-arginine translocase subunit TatC [Eggerthellaceae bacterium]
MPIGPARMPLLDHLGELRMRLVRIAVCLVIAMCIFYMATPTIAQFALQPVSPYMPHDDAGNVVMNVFGAFDAFQVRFIISLWAAIIACMPVIIWQLLAFFLPALKPKERKWFLPTFAVAVALFIFGTVFCYNIILPPAFQWLTDQANGFAQITPQADKWIDIIIKFEVGFGLAFELPLVVFYLTIFEVIPYAKLRASWRTVYIVLMVVSAFVTPDASPVTMFLMFGAMIGLYEISLAVARIVLGKRIKEQKAEMEQEEREEAEWQAEWAEKKRKRELEKEE